MGSVVSLPTAIALALIAGGILYGFVQSHPEPPQPVAKLAPPDDGTSTKKGKKKKGTEPEPSIVIHKPDEPAATPIVVPFPPVVPGSFESETQSSKSKPKKKKAKKATHTGASPVPRGDDAQSESSATAPESSTPVPRPKRRSPPVLDNDGPWTRVESRKKPGKAQEATTSTSLGVEQATSDPGITTSVTGTSEPEDEEGEAEGTDEREPENRRTLAERLLPKPRKTKVEDMLETPDVAPVARVMRVAPPPGEQPPAGFSWADYEDVDESRVTADDADGEDEGGWITKSSNRRPKPKTTTSQTAPQTATETMTKKKRQNMARHQAEKAAKAEAEVQRLATLAAHKRELDRARIAEQYTQSKKPGGGQRASVSGGHLVFE